MKKLSEYKGEEALDLLVEILEPSAEMMADQRVMNMLMSNGRRMEGIKLLIKEHKGAVIQIMAALDGVPVDQYEYSFLTLPLRLVEVLNDKELLSFFTEAAKTSSDSASGSPTENTAAENE